MEKAKEVGAKSHIQQSATPISTKTFYSVTVSVFLHYSYIYLYRPLSLYIFPNRFNHFCEKIWIVHYVAFIKVSIIFEKHIKITTMVYKKMGGVKIIIPRKIF
jgi:hypothetical protein